MRVPGQGAVLGRERIRQVRWFLALVSLPSSRRSKILTFFRDLATLVPLLFCDVILASEVQGHHRFICRL